MGAKFCRATEGVAIIGENKGLPLGLTWLGSEVGFLRSEDFNASRS